MTEKMKKSLQFVTRFYSAGALRPDDSFIKEGLSFWKRHGVAASITGFAILAAAASYTAINYSRSREENTVEKTVTNVETANEAPATDAVKDMKFEDTPLQDVVNAIEKEYGVKVSGATEGQPNLTLSYRGTAEDLVAAINDLLGTTLKIEK